MSDASLSLNGNRLSLRGVLDYRSGPQLREDARQAIHGAQASALVVDCSGVVKSSSVGLSLLLAFMRDAREAGKSLTIEALPEEMRVIADVSGLTDLLPLGA